VTDDDVFQFGLYCHVTMKFSILIDDYLSGKPASYIVQSGFESMTKAQVYGHEQKHIQSFKHFADDILIPWLAEREAEVADRPEWEYCERRAKYARVVGEGKFIQYREAEAAHSNSPYGPRRSQPVNPIGHTLPPGF
jgi:hypothetical protein